MNRTYAKLFPQGMPTQTTARRVEQGFRAAGCEPAKQSARASADALCKGNTAGALLRKPILKISVFPYLGSVDVSHR